MHPKPSDLNEYSDILDIFWSLDVLFQRTAYPNKTLYNLKP
jgi:hypothetical protein